jgi:predicted Rossmann-fold nucleotide-binding protein
VRTAEIVIIFGGGIGTLNEFTIAYDEGKIIGVLEGTGGVADRARDLASLSQRRNNSEIIFESSPEALVEKCLSTLAKLN